MISLEKMIEEWKDNKVPNNLFASKNEEGDEVIINIEKETFSVSTLQKNDWIRVNTYYKDGTMEEEYKR